MYKISAVIITYNEEKNIERCLKSVYGIVDEIVVVDSFSDDKTEEICKNYNVRFIKQKFLGHIEQKNTAMNLAQNDYILSLDADEALSEELKNSIKEIKQNFEYDAYFFNRLNFYCGKEIKHGGWFPDRKIRLWNRKKGKWGGTNPHDTVILNKDASKKYLKGNLLHYSFYSVSQHIIQIDKFSNIKADEDFKKGIKSNIFKILYKPILKFFVLYFIRLGFLDGYYGFVIANNSAYFTFLRYVKLKNKL